MHLCVCVCVCSITTRKRHRQPRPCLILVGSTPSPCPEAAALYQILFSTHQSSFSILIKSGTVCEKMPDNDGWIDSNGGSLVW